MQTSIPQEFSEHDKNIRKRIGIPSDELIQNRMPKGIPLSIARRNWQMLASRSPTSQKSLTLPFWVRSGAKILCDVCKSKDAMFACRCMTRFYCSLRHQIHDWNDNKHWGVCPWTLQTDPSWWQMVRRIYSNDKILGDINHDRIQFPLTKRPMVHLNDYPIPPSAPEMPQKGHLYMPALRYAQHSYSLKGRDDVQKTEFCGKFFFFEQNSAVLIDLGNFRIFPSKLAAALHLMPYMTEREQRHFAPKYKVLDLPIAVKSIEDIYTDLSKYRRVDKEKLRVWAKDFLRVVHLTLVQSPDNIPIVTTDPVHKHSEEGTKSPLYPNYMGHLYGGDTLDHFDQAVCHAAQRVGIDTIIFQHEGGQFHSCTETLCVDPDKALDRLVPRARTAMLREAIESNPLLAFAPYNTKFPHNWFVQDGLYIGADHGAVKRVPCSVSEDGRVIILQ